jgi:hypothetical protein
MYSRETSERLNEPIIGGGLTKLLVRVSRSLFGDVQPRQSMPAELSRAFTESARDARRDMAWLSLTCDADGHSPHEREVICMGVIPDDLDSHDPNGGDLSWIGLSPVLPSRN